MNVKLIFIKGVSFNSLQSPKTGKFYGSTINLLSNNGIDLIAFLYDKQDNYEDVNKKIPELFLLSKGSSTHIKKQSDLDVVKKDLYEIERVGRLVYGGDLCFKTSVSGNFDITYTPSIGMSLWYGYDLLADYFGRNKKPYNVPSLNSESKKKILTKVQIKK